MADANSNLNIIVKVRDEASSALSRLSGDVSDFGGSLGFAGDKAGVLASAIAAIGATTVLKNAISAFAESEAQMAKFDAIMKTLSPNLQQFRGLILETADNALLKFGFSNESAALSMARLLQATNDGNFSMRAFQAAMDLARYKGITLEESTQALILAFQGAPKLLKQFGIDIDEHASKETILAAVMKATAGQAEAFGGTLAGQLEILKEVFGEFSEALGGVFAPAIKMAIGGFTSLIESMGGVGATMQNLRPIITLIAGAFAGVLVVGIYSAISAMALLIGTSAGVIAAIAAIGATVFLFVAFWGEMWDNAVVLFEAFKVNVTNVWMSLIGTIKSSFGAAMEWIRASLVGVLAYFQSVVSTVSQPISSAVGTVQNAIGSATNAVKGVLGFAEGGIVTRPTLAMIGEGGESEAVIPLSKLGGVGGGGIQITLQGDFYTTTEVAERFGNEIARIIKNQLNLAIRA